MTVGPSHGDGAARRLTSEQLALEAGTSAEAVARLIDGGMLQRDADGLHAIEDVPRVRLATALAEGGIDFDDLLALIRSGEFGLDWVARLWAVAEPTGRTFEAFAAPLGGGADHLRSVYAAFGLAIPPPATMTRRDEELAIGAFIDFWTAIDDDPESQLRAARIAGEGIRRIQEATQDLFDELGGPPVFRLRRGLSADEAIEPATRLSPMLAVVLPWLQARHQEHEVFARIVAYVEDALAQSGRTIRREELPAIAFVDLTGYTELTVEAGDERAAQFATTLQTLAETAARRHRGRVVKLLGDGVMLRFASVAEAVESVRALMAAIESAGLPRAHAGIAAGPMVVRDGDVYGHTVNLAARIAAHAAPGELLLPMAVADRLAATTLWTDAGDAALKGLSEPVRLARVRLE